MGAIALSAFTFAQTGVGVMTENPQGTFHVDAAGDNAATGTPTAAQQANDMVVLNNGNVGIGTTAPGRKLHVLSSGSVPLRVESNAYKQTVIEFTNMDNLNAYVGFGQVGGIFSGLLPITDGEFGINPGAANKLHLTGNSIPALTVIPAGNVGIGTTDPIEKLDVVGIVRSGDVSTTAGAVFLVGRYGATADGYWNMIGSELSSAATIMGYGVKPSKTASNAYLSSTPYPGPRAAISVGGTATSTLSGNIVFSTAIDQTVAIDGAITGMTEKMIISNNGNVGIGTTTPSQKLQVNGGNIFIKGGSNPYLKIENIAGDVSFLQMSATGGLDFFTTNATNGDINFSSAGSTKMIVKTSGDIGIGTNITTSRLQVVGLPTYATDAAAGAGGLTAGAFYQTATGELRVKL